MSLPSALPVVPPVLPTSPDGGYEPPSRPDLEEQSDELDNTFGNVETGDPNDTPDETDDTDAVDDTSDEDEPVDTPDEDETSEDEPVDQTSDDTPDGPTDTVPPPAGGASLVVVDGDRVVYADPSVLIIDRDAVTAGDKDADELIATLKVLAVVPPSDWRASLVADITAALHARLGL